MFESHTEKVILPQTGQLRREKYDGWYYESIEGSSFVFAPLPDIPTNLEPTLKHVQDVLTFAGENHVLNICFGTLTRYCLFNDDSPHLVNTPWFEEVKPDTRFQLV